jgi:hypothetical protein
MQGGGGGGLIHYHLFNLAADSLGVFLTTGSRKNTLGEYLVTYNQDGSHIYNMPMIQLS